MRFLTTICIIVCVFSFNVVKAQVVSASDSVTIEQALIEKYHSLFGRDWSNQFVELWNSKKDTAKALGGLGNVYFVSAGKETTTVLMSFDSLGLATVKAGGYPSPTDTTPRFTATAIRWAQFMEGKFHAVVGVLSQKIQYKGPMTVAFKYGFHFDKVAPMGRRIVELLNEQQAGSVRKTK